MENSKVPFGKWLDDTLIQKGLKPADLSRMSGLDQAVLSNLINNKRNPAVDTCKAIADALKIPLIEVYRAADILPSIDDIDPITEAVITLMRDLNHKNKEDVLAYVRLRQQLEEAESRTKSTERSDGNKSSHNKGNRKRGLTRHAET